MTNLRGIGLMVAAMALFALEDMFIKLLAGSLPVGQVLMVLGLGGAVVFAVLARMQGQPILPRALLHPAVMLRNLGELVGTVGFVTALALTPLSSAASILQAMPLVVTMGAALFFGETVGWRRWSAIVVGFIGILIIVRPGLEGFQPASLFAVLAVFGLGARDIATRAVPPDVSSLQMSSWGFGMVVPAGAVMLMLEGAPAAVDATRALWLALGVVVGAVGYYALILASRGGDVAVITPFRYSRILFAMAIGVVIFGERPDGATLVGAAIVIASGLYTLWRERATFGRTHT